MHRPEHRDNKIRTSNRSTRQWLSGFALAAVLLFGACSAVNVTTTRSLGTSGDHQELRAIKDADQHDRQTGPNIDWRSVGERDRARLNRVRELVVRGELRTAVDFFNGALVCQHGPDVADIRLAHALAIISATMDAAATNANWLSAASWDRLMMRLDKPQWYGTQYSRAKTTDAQWELYKIDESTATDEDRRRPGVPTLAEARQRAEKMNKK